MDPVGGPLVVGHARAANRRRRGRGSRSYGSTRLEAGRRRQRLGAVDRRPADVVDRDRLAPVERVGQPAVDEHPADEPPLLGQPVERDARRRRRRGRRRRPRRGRRRSFLPLQEIERHVTPPRRPEFSRIVSTTAASASVVVSPSGAALGDVAQQPAHDLARAGLGQVRREHQVLRPGDRADDLGDVLAQLDAPARRTAPGRPCRMTKAKIAWPVIVVLLADDRRLGHRRVVDQRRFDLGRARSGGRPRSSRRRPGRAARSSRPSSRLAPSPAKYIPGKRLQ